MANERISVARLREIDPGFETHEVLHEDYAVGTLEQRVAAEADQSSLAAQADAKARAIEQRQRDEDAALADADEIVRRMRQRNGRKVCSLADGRTIREIWERLKAMSGTEVTADDDLSFR